MDQGLEWYRRNPRRMIDAKRAANNAKGMTVNQAAVYDLITDLIYEGAGKTPNNPRYLASHFSDMSERGARLAIAKLIEMGKLQLDDGGFLVNERARQEAKARSELSEERAKAGSKGGQETAKKRSRKAQETAKKGSRSTQEALKKPPRKAQEALNDDTFVNDINETVPAIAGSKSVAEKSREDLSDFAAQNPLSKTASKNTSKGSRLPEGWTANEDQREYARQQGLMDHEIDRVIEDFEGYWVAKAGAGARKTDWNRTWQGWVRRDVERREEQARRNSRHSSAHETLVGAGLQVARQRSGGGG